MEYLAQMLAQHSKYPLPTLFRNEYHRVLTIPSCVGKTLILFHLESPPLGRDRRFSMTVVLGQTTVSPPAKLEAYLTELLDIGASTLPINNPVARPHGESQVQSLSSTMMAASMASTPMSSTGVSMPTNKVFMSAIEMPVPIIKVSISANVALINVKWWLISVTVYSTPIISRSSIIRSSHTSPQKKNSNYGKKDKNFSGIHDVPPQ